MGDFTGLEERLAGAWTDGPPQPPVGDRLAAGHRALRRRRVLSTAATTLAVVAVVGAATAVTGGPGGSRAVEPAAPTASATPTTVQDPEPEEVLGDHWAGFDDEGRLVVRDGVDVGQSVEDSWQGVRWVAMELVHGDRTRWYFVSDDGSDPIVAVPPKEATPDTDAFLVWVQLQNPNPDPEAGADPAGVRFWVHLVADLLGEQDVRRPAQRGPEGEHDAEQVGAALPRLGQQHDSGGGEHGVQPAAPVAAHHRDAQRPEELQSARRAHRQPLHRGHEEHRHAGRHRAERDAGQERRAGELRPARPDDHEHDDSGPGEAQERRTLRADPVEQADRDRDADLDGEHRGHRERRTDARGGAAADGCRAGGRRGHVSMTPHLDRPRPRVVCGRSVHD